MFVEVPEVVYVEKFKCMDLRGVQVGWPREEETSIKLHQFLKVGGITSIPGSGGITSFPVREVMTSIPVKGKGIKVPPFSQNAILRYTKSISYRENFIDDIFFT